MSRDTNSVSLEETNRIRSQLGMPLLRVSRTYLFYNNLCLPRPSFPSLFFFDRIVLCFFFFLEFFLPIQKGQNKNKNKKQASGGDKQGRDSDEDERESQHENDDRSGSDKDNDTESSKSGLLLQKLHEMKEQRNRVFLCVCICASILCFARKGFRKTLLEEQNDNKKKKISIKLMLCLLFCFGLVYLHIHIHAFFFFYLKNIYTIILKKLERRVQKSRSLEEKKKENEELAKARKQFEEEEDELLHNRQKKEDNDNESGLGGKKVRHDLSQFKSGETKILILKDRGILDKRLNVINDEDELVNVELLENDKLALKKARSRKLPGYNPFDEDMSKNEVGERLLLPQYEEEKRERDGFALDKTGNANVPQFERINATEGAAPTGRAYDLMEGLPTVERDYYTTEELEGKFRKRKRKSKKNGSINIDVQDKGLNPQNHATTDTKDGNHLKSDSLQMSANVSTDDSNSHANDNGNNAIHNKKRRKLNNGQTRYDFLGGENIDEESRGQRDETAQLSRKEQQREEERFERMQKYRLAIQKNNLMMVSIYIHDIFFLLIQVKFYSCLVFISLLLKKKKKQAKAEEERAALHTQDDEEGLDSETSRALERAALLEKKRQTTEDTTRKLVTVINEMKDEETKIKKEEKKDILSEPMILDEKPESTNGLMFTQATEFSQGLKDAVGEMEEDVEQMRRRKFGVLHMNGANGVAPNGHPNSKGNPYDNEDMPAIIDPKTGLPVSRSRHHLDHLLELRESTTNVGGVWIAPEENGGKDNNKNGVSQQIASGIVKEGVSSNDFVLLENEPLVARSIADTLKHVRRRGFMDDEEFDELAGGKIQQFRPIDIEKKGNKDHLEWDVPKVLKWLREVGLARYQNTFQKKQVDGRVLDSVTLEFGVRVLQMDDEDCHKLLQALGELKGDPAPDVHLSYLDDTGRPMTAKEAFRKLSHRFHGKKPGKRKQEKRIKKREEEFFRKNRNGVDTPLGTLEKLKQATEYSGKPFIVLNGKETTKMAQTIDYSDEKYDAKRRL
ncbi:U4/U6.U5 tri-snRNP-associated protein 1 [Reticulomyxa filosa]|uniref:U4/U6.U5 tri-snRNP-associated protein 1 n=1 Tax=Reticulomyxa filosa TaxID=46433 RepID=X6PE61_RETFI|nr:U4/U6.U5 tri-snRNP-associated protein 1 [Reticulomyxa filosa]|eukprot:ETO36501.1 U4/U6.U5 tri-snRNP-associated protein 1 [Reticulomyxa filosa]